LWQRSSALPRSLPILSATSCRPSGRPPLPSCRRVRLSSVRQFPLELAASRLLVFWVVLTPTTAHVRHRCASRRCVRLL
jgi:hypothetical protein